MRIDEACRRVTELNREQEAMGTATRYVVLSASNGTAGTDCRIVARRVGGPAGRARQRR